MYDFAHGQSDYFEGVTHSLCTLEFEVHRPLYDWFIDQLKTDDYRPRQIEFNRLNLTYTMMSKRKLLELGSGGKGQRMGRSQDANFMWSQKKRLHS
jgi:glutaminyl-tRNA synthetase